ncbi:MULTISPECIES: hypothetical protein [Mycobacterium]|nr:MULTISPECIES: hypothetical protein [Mycobacterium]MDP7707206.1 hypothetical protein [Mycobacterium sp. TY815]
MSHPNRFPWLSGLIAALTVAGWLVYEVVADAMTVIGSAVDDAPAF